jgi:hypothetical protein
MKRGPKPKSIQAQLAAGDPRKVGKNKLERLLAAEPKASSGLPSCPEHQKGRARDAWAFWSAELAVMDMDRPPGRPDARRLLRGL